MRTYEKLGIPLNEQKFLSGVAVDAIFDSVSVGTTMKKELGELGIVFCSLGEAVREHPELVQKYLGSVVPYSDNFFAALNSARCSPRGRSSTCPRVCAARWSCRRTSASMRRHGAVRAHAHRGR